MAADASSIAKAYVQIMPSAKGIKEMLDKEMGGPAEKAGHTAGHGIAGGIKKAIAAAGIGAALSKTIMAGANLEQSIGGIETLFGEAAEAVKQRANEAFHTAGMSANEYMELATSFSASLLQSLGGDTQAAADIADMAMTDMSDNANKMGTDMQRITDAYQGFAKQNYTMLDNLKLGYGGTKGEMERLLKDAQAFSGVKYDINNLSDVYEAIHVIQEQMGVTGATADEATRTLQGSAKAMKAAFSNVLGKLTLGQDIGPALQDLANTTTTFLVGNLLPAVWNIIKALPGGLVTFVKTAAPQMAQGFMSFIPELWTALQTVLPQLLEFAKRVLVAFVDGFPAAFPRLLESGADIMGQILNGLGSAVPQLLQTAVVLVGTFIEKIVENFPLILSKGSEMLGRFISGISQSLPQLIETAGRMIARIVEGLISNFPSIISSGFELIVSLIQGIGNAFPDIIHAAGEVISMIWDTIKETDWLSLGKDIIRGLIDGIGAMAGALWEAAKNIARTALDSIKDFFGIASPSKLMRDEVGKWIPAGLALGITGNTAPVRKAMAELAGLATDGVPRNVAMRMQPAFSATPAYAGGYGQTVLNQTIYTHDSLSESELTREAEDMLARQKWGLP